MLVDGGSPPRTRLSLAQDLRRLGVVTGDTLLVHASLSALGWVCGGAAAVVHALLDVLGPAGTMAVPAHTANNRDPSRWTDPPVPESWWPLIREHLPAFDPALTPSEGMGVIAEQVRTWPGAERSVHPQTSFAAVGPLATRLTAGHELPCHLGEASPLARLEEVGAKVLLLGVGFDRCTAFHLGEYRVPDPQFRQYSCAVLTPDGRQWVTYTDIVLDQTRFGELGAAFETHSGTVAGAVGSASARLFPLSDAVAFAVDWFKTRRER